MFYQRERVGRCCRLNGRKGINEALQTPEHTFYLRELQLDWLEPEEQQEDHREQTAEQICRLR